MSGDDINVKDRFKKILDYINIEYDSIYMFGSRARGDFEADSDWDFLITLKEDISPKIRRDMKLKIYKEFHNIFPFISIDIVIKSIKDFEDEKSIPNTVSNDTYLEGIRLWIES